MNVKKMFKNNKIVNHLSTVFRHKYYVGKYCFKFGLYYQGIMHDLSKLSLTELIPSIKYYQGYRSPIDREKEVIGYSNAWVHHHNHNPHHWLYWVDWNNKNEVTPVKIPYRYAIESVCDWIGAGIVYAKNSSKEFNWSEPYEYYKLNTRVNHENHLNNYTLMLWDTILVDLHLYNIDYVINRHKSGYYKYIYEHTCEEDLDYYNNKVVIYYK